MLEDRYITREEVHCDIMLILSFPFDQLFQTIFFLLSAFVVHCCVLLGIFPLLDIFLILFALFLSICILLYLSLYLALCFSGILNRKCQ